MRLALLATVVFWAAVAAAVWTVIR